MRKMEYRIERLPFEENYDAHTKVVLERLMELGMAGWEVASVDLTWHPSYSPAAQAHTPVPVLLQREIA